MPPALPGERWWRQPPKGGALFLARKGGLPVFPGRKHGCKGFFILRRRRHHNPRDLKGRVKLSNPQAAGLSNLGPKGRQPSRPKGRVHKGAHHNPHGLKGRVKPENPQAAGLSNLGPKGRQPGAAKRPLQKCPFCIHLNIAHLLHKPIHVGRRFVECFSGDGP